MGRTNLRNTTNTRKPMKYEITITGHGNAAFEASPAQEIKKIAAAVAYMIQRNKHPLTDDCNLKTVMDENGNTLAKIERTA